MIKNIVFDFGGVIADLDKQKAVEAFKSLGIQEAEKYLDPYLQSGAFLEAENGKTDAAGFIAAMQELSGRELSFAQVQNAWLAFITGISRKKMVACAQDAAHGTRLGQKPPNAKTRKMMETQPLVKLSRVAGGYGGKTVIRDVSLEVFPNDFGTAPGCAFYSENGSLVMMFPGPPSELIPMLKQYGVPYLKRFSEGVILSRMMRSMLRR